MTHNGVKRLYCKGPILMMLLLSCSIAGIKKCKCIWLFA